MDRNQFIIATSIALFCAFLFGWIASMILGRMARASNSDLGELDSMAVQLADAEEGRDQAIATLEEREADLNSRIAGKDVDIANLQDALREANREVDDLRAYIDKILGRS